MCPGCVQTPPGRVHMPMPREQGRPTTWSAGASCRSIAPCSNKGDVRDCGSQAFRMPAVPRLRRFHEKVGGCQAQCTLGAGSSEAPPTPSSPAFRSGAEKAPQMNPGAFSAPCKMQAMGPLRSLCQTLFVWRCDRGPQPATVPPAPMAITSGFVSFRYNLPQHKKHRGNFESAGSIQI
jgi:hypothetical protein